MKLIRFGSTGAEQPGVMLEDGTRLDVSAAVADYDDAFFAGDGVQRVRAWLDRNATTAPRVAADVRLGPPVRRPSKIVCIGLNYRDHATETGLGVPTEPLIFMKAPSALAGPNDDVIIPRGAAKLDWEVELAVVIAKEARHVEPAGALKCVAGYAVFNDYSERAFQFDRGGQFVKGKSADSFAPLGPVLVTRDEMPDTRNLGIWLTVNGTTRQKSTTANLMVDVAGLVSYVSEFMTLVPGDVLSTGTPSGVGLGMKPEPVYLKAGDEVVAGIDGLGEQRQRVVVYRDE
jgi:2-keto-4-pentenoate hydratase/2-oxohepta-3-ene-1,7-dioic acid hydratase in catechol pathway